MSADEVNLEEWATTVPEEIRADAAWRLEAYRLALFAADLAWRDITKLSKDRRTAALSDQLYCALGSIGANLAEGYSRGTGADRARFYEYTLGSARESKDWYFKSRHVLDDTLVRDRLKLLSRITRLLLVMVPNQRGRILREEGLPYRVQAESIP